MFPLIGDSIENIGWKSKKSVLVDVGGVKSSVGSQYISNHDFLEVSLVPTTFLYFLLRKDSVAKLFEDT